MTDTGSSTLDEKPKEFRKNFHESADIIDVIIASYRKYEAPYGVDAENKHVKFWIQCIKTGLAEVESDLSPENIKKEFADLAFIAIDGLYKMGYQPRPILWERLEQNYKKDLSKRTMSFYAEKHAALESDEARLKDIVEKVEALKVKHMAGEPDSMKVHIDGYNSALVYVLAILTADKPMERSKCSHKNREIVVLSFDGKEGFHCFDCVEWFYKSGEKSAF